jgi:PAS domain S-box-containing protein
MTIRKDAMISMNTTIDARSGEEMHILILEDVPSDAELIEEELVDAGLLFKATRVDTRAAFVREMERFSPDLILADYSLPSFDGISALKITLEKAPDIPFIFVSGALGEELAIELVKSGATDYVLKNRLSRLAPAVHRAMKEVEERAEKKRIEEALKESEARYRTIFENTGTATIIVEEDQLVALANREFEKLTGFPRPDVEGQRSWIDFLASEERERVSSLISQRKIKSPYICELCICDRQGSRRDTIATIAAIAPTKRAVISFLDITDRKKAEEALKRREHELELKSQSLEEANTALKVLLKHREDDKIAMEEKVLLNVKKLISPYIEKLKNLNLDKNQVAHVDIIEAHLEDIISPFLHNMTSQYLNLTPREIEVASLVKEGKTTKEISELLNISATAVDFHRKNLRTKFSIKNKKANLRSYLLSLSL